MKVKVYFNLHKKVFSIMAMEGASKGLVIQHAANVELANAVFKVSEAGRQRVLREKRKNVHAFVVGELVEAHEGHPNAVGELVTYNPYKGAEFVRVFNGEAVKTAKTAQMYTENQRGRIVVR